MRRNDLLVLCCVLTVATAVLLSGRIQLFQPIGWVDPGIYLGYELDYRALSDAFGATYFQTRLPYLFPAIGLHQIAPHAVATMALAIVWSVAGCLGLFLLVYWQVGAGPAALATLWLALNPLWLAAVARGYVDGAVSAYSLLALALLLRCDHSARRGLLPAAGGALGAFAVYTHPIAVFLISIPLAASALVAREQWQELWRKAAWAFGGFLGMSLALGVVSLLSGGKFVFFLADTYAIQRSFNGFGANYRYALADWAPRSYRLLPPLAFLLLGAAGLFRATGPARTLVACGLASMIGVGGLLIFWDFVIGGATLQSSFYGSYLIPGQALIVGGLIALWRQKDPRIPLEIAAVCVVLAALVLVAVPHIWAVEGSFGPGTVWLSLAAAFALAFFLRRRSGRAAIALLFGATLVAAAANKDTRRIFLAPDGVDFGAAYRTTVQLHELVAETVPRGTPKLFWYNRDSLTRVEEPRADWALYRLKFQDSVLTLNYWDSATSLWLWERSALGWSMPKMDDQGRALLAAYGSASIIMFCLQPDECDTAEAALRDQKFTVSEVRRARLDAGYVPFWVRVVRVSPVDSAG